MPRQLQRVRGASRCARAIFAVRELGHRLYFAHVRRSIAMRRRAASAAPESDGLPPQPRQAAISTGVPPDHWLVLARRCRPRSSAWPGTHSGTRALASKMRHPFSRPGHGLSNRCGRPGSDPRFPPHGQNFSSSRSLQATPVSAAASAQFFAAGVRGAERHQFGDAGSGSRIRISSPARAIDKALSRL